MLNLVVGKPAPEIEGADMDGKPFKLSDYKGKVVVLVFWGTWCGPCMAQVPHERELVQPSKASRSPCWGSIAKTIRARPARSWRESE